MQTWCDDGRRGTRAIVCWTIVCWTLRRTTEASRPPVGERTLTLHERMGEWARGGTDVLPLQSPANSPLQTAPIAKPQFSLRPSFP